MHNVVGKCCALIHIIKHQRHTKKSVMADSANDTTRPFRYTAAVAKVRGTYPYISDIVDDVPVVSKMDYWDRRDYATPYHPAVGYLFSARPRSAPSHLKSGHSVDRYSVMCTADIEALTKNFKQHLLV